MLGDSKGIMPSDENSFDYVDFLKSDYSATINDGVYSAVELFSNGFFKEHLTIANDMSPNLSSIPYPFSGFADLCTEEKIGVLLTESGDILIVNNKSFAIRNIMDFGYSAWLTRLSNRYNWN